MSKKTKLEIRCSNSVDRKNDGKLTKCSRFLAEVSDHKITIPCPRCGSTLIITSDRVTGKLKTSIIPKGGTLLQADKKKETKNG